MAPTVFISYSRQDTPFVERLIADLEAQDVTVWIDQEDLHPGTPDWEAALRQAIEGADWILLAASPSSRASVYVQDELAYARLQDVPIIPVWVNGDEWLDSISLGMGRVQYVDLRGARYNAGIEDLIAILHNAEPEKAVDIQTGLLPVPVRYALVYGLPGGLLTGLLLQHPLRDWLERWLLTDPSWDRLSVLGMLLVPLLPLIFGLALTQLFVGQHKALPARDIRYMAGALMGAVFGVAAHTMAVGSYFGLIANRDMLYIFNHTTQSPEWLHTLANATVQTLSEGTLSAVLTVLVLTGVGAAMSRWLLPLSTAAFVPARTRDLFWPLLIIVGLYYLEVTIFTAAVVSVNLDRQATEVLREIGERPSVSILAMTMGPAWAVKLTLQAAALIWLWRVPLAYIHRTGLRTAQIAYGLLFVLLSALLWLGGITAPGLVLTKFVLLPTSLLLALAFAALAQRKLRQAAAITLPVGLKLVWWRALLIWAALILVFMLVVDLLLAHSMLSLVLITVVMITADTAANAPWDVVFDSTMHGLPFYLPVLLFWPFIFTLALLLPYMLFATRRERRISAPAADPAPVTV